MNSTHSLTRPSAHSLTHDRNPAEEPLSLPSPPAIALDRRAPDDPLSPHEIRTLLDMLAVMVAPDELALLDYLSPQQKQQLWEHTPKPLRIQLHRLKQTPPPHSTHLPFQLGDRVVLLAHPALSSAELIAIWTVIGHSSDQILCTAPTLGDRLFPSRCLRLWPPTA